jgi:hypothetical protein
VWKKKGQFGYRNKSQEEGQVFFEDPSFERLFTVRYSEVKERLIRPEKLLMALRLTTTERCEEGS